MLCRIEADTPKAPCGVVTEEMSDEAMCSFVKSDGDDYWDRPGLYGVAAHDLLTLFPFYCLGPQDACQNVIIKAVWLRRIRLSGMGRMARWRFH